MPKQAKKVDLQIRGVPPDLRRRVAKKAASKGMSMSMYVRQLLEDDIERPATVREWLAEVEAVLGPPRDVDFDAADSVIAIRRAIDRAVRGE